MGLDSVELVMAVEQELDIQIPDSEAATIVTPRDFANIVELALKKQNRTMSRSEIGEKIKEISIEQLSLKEREYHQDKEYGRDFGMD